jgi:membrane-associated phospholipid phosphatase
LKRSVPARKSTKEKQLLQRIDAGLSATRRSLAPLFVALGCLSIGFIPVQLFDQYIFLTLNGLHSPFSDLAWISLTTLGDGWLLAIILGCFLLVNPQVTFVGLATILLSSVAVHCVKAIFLVPRPIEAIGAVHTVGPILRWGSFPSGHAAASMSAALAMAYFASSKVMSTIVLCLAALISASRIFVGAHFPADVLIGIIIALAAFGSFFTSIWPSLHARIPTKPNFSSIYYKAALWVELLAALFALCIYAPFAAESPVIAATVSVLVLTFLGVWYRKVRRSVV